MKFIKSMRLKMRKFSTFIILVVKYKLQNRKLKKAQKLVDKKAEEVYATIENLREQKKIDDFNKENIIHHTRRTK